MYNWRKCDNNINVNNDDGDVIMLKTILLLLLMMMLLLMMLLLRMMMMTTMTKTVLISSTDYAGAPASNDARNRKRMMIDRPIWYRCGCCRTVHSFIDWSSYCPAAESKQPNINRDQEPSPKIFVSSCLTIILAPRAVPIPAANVTICYSALMSLILWGLHRSLNPPHPSSWTFIFESHHNKTGHGNRLHHLHAVTFKLHEPLSHYWCRSRSASREGVILLD